MDEQEHRYLDQFPTKDNMKGRINVPKSVMRWNKVEWSDHKHRLGNPNLKYRGKVEAPKRETPYQRISGNINKKNLSEL